jgi:SAM-dependent methyltransferase
MLESHFGRLAMMRAWAAHDAEAYRAFVTEASRLAGQPIARLRVLDLGCGPNAPMTVLLAGAGCRVTGVDARLGVRWGLGLDLSRYSRYLKTAGLLRTIRKAAGELTYDRTYFRELSRLTGLTLHDRGLDLREMDVQAPALPANEFDVIHSNATWEHIADVPAANRTIAAALRPGGVAYIEIHLFPSLSGGHDLPWIVPGRTVLGDIRPWQHLRDPAWQAPVFLNRLRERDYRRHFEETPGLEIVDWRVEFTEGQEYLTDEIRAQLSDYTDDELTRRSIIAILRNTA